MIGAILGDIVGSVYEFNNTSQYDFTMFTPDSTFTDDTICTIVIADALVSGKGYRQSLLEWCNRYPNPMGGYGVKFLAWLRSRNHEPYYSFGNGSAMRVSPVAWWFSKGYDVIKAAEETASVSHNHPEGVRGAVAVASSIHWLICNKDGFSKDNFLTRLNCYYPHYSRHQQGIFNETCQGTVPLCMEILANSTSFEDAIRTAISFGGDSDTIGAIVGSMTEARFGIPDELTDKVFKLLPGEMLRIIERFYAELNKRSKFTLPNNIYNV